MSRGARIPSATHILRALSISGLLFSAWCGWLGYERANLLRTLSERGQETQGYFEKAPIDTKSGPQPEPDWIYHYEVDGEHHSGSIRGRRPFMFQVGSHSVKELGYRPVAGETLPVYYLPEDPKLSAPFKANEVILRYNTVVASMYAALGLVVAGVGWWLSRVFRN